MSNFAAWLRFGFVALVASVTTAPANAASVDLALQVEYSDTRLSPGEHFIITVQMSNLSTEQTEPAAVVLAQPYPPYSRQRQLSGECGPDSDLNPTRANPFGVQEFPRIPSGGSHTCNYEFIVNDDAQGERIDEWAIQRIRFTSDDDPNLLNNVSTVSVEYGIFSTSVPAQSRTSALFLGLIIMLLATRMRSAERG